MPSVRRRSRKCPRRYTLGRCATYRCKKTGRRDPVTGKCMKKGSVRRNPVRSARRKSNI
jgi:predicted nucleotidyltransferase